MFERIVVPLDGSRLSERIEPYVTQLAKGFSSELRLVHIINPNRFLADLLLGEQQERVEIAEVVEKAKAQIENYLQQPRARLVDLGIPTTTSLVSTTSQEGPGEAILDYASRQGADLIAMTTHGRVGVERWLIGSVASELLHTSPIPLLLVRPSEVGAPPSPLTEVLVPLDGSDLAESVLPHVVTLANVLKLKVTLFRSVPIPIETWEGGEYAVYSGKLLDEMQTLAETYLEGIADRLAADGLETTREVHIGDAGVTVTDFADQRPGTLITLSTHGRSGLGRWLLGSVADKVVRSGVAPVLVVRPQQIS
jgi:nucleotide-binding universal stress UspA family protein